MTSSAGASGLISSGSPPSSRTASRMVARSTTHGTPVKSCMTTRAGVNWISVSGSARRVPRRDRPDVVGGDVRAVLGAEQVLQEDLQGVREACRSPRPCPGGRSRTTSRPPPASPLLPKLSMLPAVSFATRASSRRPPLAAILPPSGRPAASGACKISRRQDICPAILPRHAPRPGRERIGAVPTEPEDVRSSLDRQSFMALLGATATLVESGHVQIEVPYRADLCQQNGFLHAGVLTSVADSACGYAALTLMPAGSDVLSVEFKVNLLAPARGDRVRRGRPGRAQRPHADRLPGGGPCGRGRPARRHGGADAGHDDRPAGSLTVRPSGPVPADGQGSVPDRSSERSRPSPASRSGRTLQPWPRSRGLGRGETTSSTSPTCSARSPSGSRRCAPANDSGTLPACAGSWSGPSSCCCHCSSHCSSPSTPEAAAPGSVTAGRT